MGRSFIVRMPCYDSVVSPTRCTAMGSKGEGERVTWRCELKTRKAGQYFLCSLLDLLTSSTTQAMSLREWTLTFDTFGAEKGHSVNQSQHEAEGEGRRCKRRASNNGPCTRSRTTGSQGRARPGRGSLKGRSRASTRLNPCCCCVLVCFGVLSPLLGVFRLLPLDATK